MIALGIFSYGKSNLLLPPQFYPFLLRLFAFVIFYQEILTEKPNKMQECIKILLFRILNAVQHVSGDTPPIIRSPKLHKQTLDLHTWKAVGRAVVGLCQVAYAT